ncbi:MAG: metal ABC transporter substrate-binding protein [Pseudobutyrivibrio sp.]|nr:metal ABC transporter substrate-binding protein [Pseudobutyrivibrio sp.]
MKKTFSVLLSTLLIAGCLSACGAEAQPAADSATQVSTETAASHADNIQIVTTIFPEYDWVMNILGDSSADAEVTMLLDNGVDLHSFQPSAEDILKISSCDLFIYVGGESDQWVDEALDGAQNQDMVVINLLDVLGDSVKEEEVIEGMQTEEHEHDHDDAHDEDEEEHEHEHEEGDVEYDEHVWLSLKNTTVLVENISQALETLDPDNADTYASNTSDYVDKLNALDSKYQDTVSNSTYNTLLFGDRFPFRYLVDDYNLNYYAAFVGCSAETEASFETITFLANKMDELSLPVIMTIEGADYKIAETIIQNTQTKDQQILTLDSMQSVTAKDVENGASYLSIMENNLSVLKDALK